MIDLTTSYLGMQLTTPLVVSASPLTKDLDTVRRLEQAGAGALVLFSLTEEQITNVHPSQRYSTATPEAYLAHLHAVKQAVSIPVIGSLNGITQGNWVRYARYIEQAGADALELNLYYLASSPDLSANDLEDHYATLVRQVRQQITIPLALKLTPFFTSLPATAHRFTTQGADALVLFNRFYQPDIDLETLTISNRVILSTSQELLLPLRWIAMLHGRISADFALSGGVHTATDVLKAVVVGANVAMLTSELLAKGPQRLANILADIRAWMEFHGHTSLAPLRGVVSEQATVDPSIAARDDYLQALRSFDSPER